MNEDVSSLSFERKITDKESGRVLVVSPDISSSHWSNAGSYDALFVRGHIKNTPGNMSPDPSPLNTAIVGNATGVVISCTHGFVNYQQLMFARRVLNSGFRVWFHWIFEDIAESADKVDLRRHFMQWLLAVGVVSLRAVWRVARFVRALLSSNAAEKLLVAEDFHAIGRWFSSLVRSHDNDMVQLEIVAMIRQLQADPKPLEAHPLLQQTSDQIVSGQGVYLRLDFWAAMIAGGSFTHTCFVAKELSARTKRFRAYLANTFELLDEFGVHQTVLPRPKVLPGEEGILSANAHYVSLLRKEFENEKPAYVYERYCLGNVVGAALCREFQIPYILEYNGSEISMSKSFGGIGYALEQIFADAEDFSLAQATHIVVVSSVLRDQLIERGIDKTRIIVNPNGVDTEIFTPASKPQRDSVLNELQWPLDSFVVGFIGTFGGWHGISILAEALPGIAKRCPKARFLLIGDGTERAHFERQLKNAGIGNKIHFTGLAGPTEARRMLGGCDLFLSPHDRHMKDSPFFGSPTKLFEYMSLGKPIVASDLEQIGAVLSPGLHHIEIDDMNAEAGNWRGVLCEPGSASDIVESVVKLSEKPAMCRMLGENARNAVIEHFSWHANVARVLNGLDGAHLVSGGPGAKRTLNYLVKKQADIEYIDVNGSWVADLLRTTFYGVSSVLDVSSVGVSVKFETGSVWQPKMWLSYQNASDIEAESVDAIFGYVAISGSNEPVKLMRDALRCLKPGGRFMLIEFSERSFFYWYNICLWRGLRWAWAYHKSFGTLLEELDNVFPGGTVSVRRSLREGHVRQLLKNTKALHFSSGPPDPIEHIPSYMVPRGMRSRIMLISGEK